jgi:hypothetical protein
VNVGQETTVSDGALDLGSDLTSYTPEIGKLAGWDEHLSLIAGEAADLHRELARLQEQSDDVARLLEQREVELERREAERAATENSISQLEVDFARAQQELAQARTSQREAENSLQVSREQDAEHRRALGQLRTRVAELEELATPSAQVPPEPQCHLRFVALSTGYALSEIAEPPPKVGELIEIDGRRFSVARIGRSPLPGDARPCASLLIEPTRTTPQPEGDAIDPPTVAVVSL